MCTAKPTRRQISLPVASMITLLGFIYFLSQIVTFAISCNMISLVFRSPDSTKKKAKVIEGNHQPTLFTFNGVQNGTTKLVLTTPTHRSASMWRSEA
ncbi:hypothetical protein LINPERPRIM_LOCUS15457 [Linum perenne]